MNLVLKRIIFKSKSGDEKIGDFIKVGNGLILIIISEGEIIEINNEDIIEDRLIDITCDGRIVLN